MFDQVVGKGFDQVLGEEKNHKYGVQYCRDGYSVLYYSDGKIYYAVLFLITPSQKDPKQQKLRIHVQPRWDLGPYKNEY